MSSSGWLLADGNDQVALIDAGTGETVTYRHLAARVDTRVGRLEHCAGAVVLLGMSNTIASVIDYLAFTSVGATVLLTDPTAAEDTVAVWRAAYQPEVVFGFAHVADLIRAGNDKVSVESVLLPTSGSTGSPKFVRLSKTNLAANAAQIVQALRIDRTHRGFGHLPLFYSYGLSVLNSHLAAGATVVLSSASAVRPEFWDAISTHRVTSLPGVPYSYEIFRRMNFAQRLLPDLTDLTQAGGRLAPELVLEFRETMAAKGGRMWVMYGQTEASARISVLPPEELPARVGSVGRPLLGSRVWIDDPDAMGVGELIVEGPQVMLGYASCRGDLDGVDHCGGVLSTGDLGRVDTDGLVWITGRLKRIAKVFGERVNLDDIERQLSGFGSIAAVDDGDRVAVFVETDSVPADLARRMERHLGFAPRSIAVHGVSRLPTTLAGKVDYQTLRDVIKDGRCL